MKHFDLLNSLNILILPDKFKGNLTAREIAEVISSVIQARTKSWKIENVPLADGGDGSLSLLLGKEFKALSITCKGALGSDGIRRIGINGKFAFIELAEICGIGLLDGNNLDPFRASTFGLGQALLAAIGSGAETVTFSLGGSASLDGGFGLLCALGARGFDQYKNEVTPDLRGLMELATIDIQKPLEIAKKIRVDVLVDVDNPLTGVNGATHIYGAQKGLKSSELSEVDNALGRWAKLLSTATGKEVSLLNGLGSAGGTPVALINIFNSTLIPGSQWFLDKFELRSKIRGADLIITTEGKFDAQSMMGKITGEVIKECTIAKKACVVIAGEISDQELKINDVHFVSLSKLSGSSNESIKNSRYWLAESINLLIDTLSKAK